MPEGYIKLHRKMTEWGWYKDSNTKIVFLHLLLTANWKDGEFMGTPVSRGQCVFGRKELSKKLGVSEQSVRTALEHLKSTSEITIKSTNKYSIATIVKFNDYQILDDETNQQNIQQSNIPSTNNQPTTNHIQEGKKVRKKEEINTIRDLLTDFSPDFQIAFLEYSEMRTKIKHPLTFRAAQLALNQLDKLAKTDTEKIAILNQSVFHSWQGVFALKDNTQQQNVSPNWGYEGMKHL